MVWPLSETLEQAAGDGRMTVEERNERLREIERLNRSLECWLKTPMLESVRQIGAEAIRCKMSDVSRPLRKDENCEKSGR
jgi:hypothetical protein